MEELAKRGIRPAGLKGKGKFRHKLYANQIDQHKQEQGWVRCWLERTLGNKTFDVVGEDRDGNLTGVEICLSGSAKWNAQQLIKAAGVEGVVEVIVACERKEDLQAILREVGEIDALGLYRKKIVGKLLAEFLA